MVATAIYSVTTVLWKETAFPLCRAMERRYYYDLFPSKMHIKSTSTIIVCRQ